MDVVTSGNGAEAETMDGERAHPPEWPRAQRAEQTHARRDCSAEINTGCLFHTGRLSKCKPAGEGMEDVGKVEGNKSGLQ